jgi:hypothetical protein
MHRLVSPFQGLRTIPTATRGGATLCPGLICPCPFGTAARKIPLGIDRTNRERRGNQTSPTIENAKADRSDRSQRHRGGERLANGVFNAA